MALAATTLWELNQGATANNVNGGGFNYANANFLTDLTTDSNTANTNSPVISSASYNFVAGDVGHWVCIRSGTNWYPYRWCQIASVAANKATLSAAVGAALDLNTTTRKFTANTTAGVASVGTPTGGTFGVDYSQSTGAILAVTDGASTASTTFNSATGGFTRVMVGNHLNLVSATGADEVVGWREIVNYTDTNNVVLDATTGTYTAGVANVGGAMSMNSTLDDDFMEVLIGGNVVHINNNGTAYTIGETITIASSSPTTTDNIIFNGYNTLRGDNPTGTNRPTMDCAGLAMAFASNKQFYNIIWTGSATTVFTPQSNSYFENCKLANTSTGSGRNAVLTNSTQTTIFNCELVSQNGEAIEGTSSQKFIGNFIHSCDSGISLSAGAGVVIAFNVFENCKTAHVTGSTLAANTIMNNTFYGAETTPVGIGFRSTGATAANNVILNNNFYGLATGIEIATIQQDSVFEDYNNFYNCTTNRTRVAVGTHSVAVNPSFSSASQILFSNGTTSGSVLTSSGADFSTVTDNVDYVRIVSGTGVTAMSYLITSHTTDTLTLNVTPGTNATADKVGVVYVEHNYAISGNI